MKAALFFTLIILLWCSIANAATFKIVLIGESVEDEVGTTAHPLYVQGV